MGRRLLILAMAAVSAAGMAACGEEEATDQPRRGAGEPQDVRYEGSFTVLESPDHGPELCTFVQTSLPPQCGGLPVTNWSWDDVEGEESRNGTTWGAWHVTGTYGDGSFTLTATPDHRPGSRRPGPTFAPACPDPDVVDRGDGEAEWESATQDREPLHIDDLVTMWVTGSGGRGDDFVVNVVVRPGAGDAAFDAIRDRYKGGLCVVERDLPTDAELRTIQDELLDDDAKAGLGPVLSTSPDPIRGAIVVEVWVVDDDAAAYALERWDSRVILRPVLHRVDG